MTYPIGGGFPNWTSRFTDESGRLTRDGMALLQLLFNRTGATTGDFLTAISGLAGTPIFLDSSDESSDDVALIPGPQGLQGLQGAIGQQGPIGPALMLDVPDQEEQVWMPPRTFGGGWFDEKGSGGTYGFAAGVDFTGGTSTTLTLSQPYGSQANLIVAFDTGFQGPDQFSLSGKTLTFTSAIPSGISKVYVKGFLMPQ